MFGGCNCRVFVVIDVNVEWCMWRSFGLVLRKVGFDSWFELLVCV